MRFLNSIENGRAVWLARIFLFFGLVAAAAKHDDRNNKNPKAVVIVEKIAQTVHKNFLPSPTMSAKYERKSLFFIGRNHREISPTCYHIMREAFFCYGIF